MIVDRTRWRIGTVEMVITSVSPRFTRAVRGTLKTTLKVDGYGTIKDQSEREATRSSRSFTDR